VTAGRTARSDRSDAFGANVLAKVEAALAAVEDEVLAGLDDEQRETLYSLLQQATSDHAPACPRVIDEY
jgi:hypothetical protein